MLSDTKFCNSLKISAPLPGLPAVRTMDIINTLLWCGSCDIFWPTASFEMCPNCDSIKCAEFCKTSRGTISFSRTVLHGVDYGAWNSFAKKKLWGGGLNRQ